MFEPFNSTLIGLTEITLALLVFHRAMPAVRIYGPLWALKYWFLGFALGMFGFGRLFGPVVENNFSMIFSMGHYCLIGYGISRLAKIIAVSDTRWGDHL